MLGETCCSIPAQRRSSSSCLAMICSICNPGPTTGLDIQRNCERPGKWSVRLIRLDASLCSVSEVCQSFLSEDKMNNELLCIRLDSFSRHEKGCFYVSYQVTITCNAIGEVQVRGANCILQNSISKVCLSC